ncbi:MAG: type II toxin-antitoxin system VapC family toxin [Phycisphaerales bacterium]
MLDCSVALSWCFEDEARPETDAVLARLAKARALVPVLWHAELANAFVVAERRGRVTSAQAQSMLAFALRLPIDVDDRPRSPTISAVVAVARAHRLTGYDAFYVELALSRSLPIATADAAVRKAAVELGIRSLV